MCPKWNKNGKKHKNNGFCSKSPLFCLDIWIIFGLIGCMKKSAWRLSFGVRWNLSGSLYSIPLVPSQSKPRRGTGPGNVLHGTFAGRSGAVAALVFAERTDSSNNFLLIHAQINELVSEVHGNLSKPVDCFQVQLSIFSGFFKSFFWTQSSKSSIPWLPGISVWFTQLTTSAQTFSSWVLFWIDRPVGESLQAVLFLFSAVSK